MKEKILLLFSVGDFNRSELDRMNDEELLSINGKDEEKRSLIYKDIEDFCADVNDEIIDPSMYWMYSVAKKD